MQTWRKTSDNFKFLSGFCNTDHYIVKVIWKTILRQHTSCGLILQVFHSLRDIYKPKHSIYEIFDWTKAIDPHI